MRRVQYPKSRLYQQFFLSPASQILISFFFLLLLIIDGLKITLTGNHMVMDHIEFIWLLYAIKCLVLIFIFSVKMLDSEHIFLCWKVSYFSFVDRP